MIKLLTIAFIVLFFTGTGDTFPTSGTNVDRSSLTDWLTPGNITTDDTNDATCNGSGSDYLVAKTFGFSLPAAAVIQGITVIADCSEHSPSSETVSVQLQDETGTLFGSAKTFGVIGTTKTPYTSGGVTDIWGAVITKAIVEDADFGVRFWYTTSHDVRINYVTMNVEYTIYNKKGQFFQFFTQTKSSKQITSL